METTNKSILKDRAFRKGILSGAPTMGGAALYFIGKTLTAKIKEAVNKRRERRELKSILADLDYFGDQNEYLTNLGRIYRFQMAYSSQTKRRY